MLVYIKEFKVGKCKQITAKNWIILEKTEDSSASCQLKNWKEYCCLEKWNIFNLEQKVSLFSVAFLEKTGNFEFSFFFNKINNLRCYTAFILILTGTLKSLNQSSDLSSWGLLKCIRSDVLPMLQCRLLWSFLNFRPTPIWFFTRSKSILWWELPWPLKLVGFFPAGVALL